MRLTGFLLSLMLAGTLLLSADPVPAETGVAYSELFRLVVDGPSAVEDTAPAWQPCFRRIYPNPFNPVVTIEYQLPQATTVELALYDLRGRRVLTLVDGEVLNAGLHEAAWKGRDATGQVVAAGVYLCRLKTSSGIRHRRLTLLK